MYLSGHDSPKIDKMNDVETTFPYHPYIDTFHFTEIISVLKGAWGVFGSRHSKLSFWALFILGRKSYQLLFTASKNIVPSRSYGLSNLGSRL